MYFKESVQLCGIKPEVVAGMNLVVAHFERGFSYLNQLEAVVTSVCDGAHKTPIHKQGLAFDLRSKEIPTLEAKKDFLARCEKRLGPEWDCVLEQVGLPNEHFHFEWQPKNK